MTLQFPSKTKSKFHTFFYGACSEDQFPQLVASAEDNGFEFVQVLGGMMQPKPSLVAPPGAGPPAPVAVLRLIVRCLASEFEGLIEKMKAMEGK